MIQIGFRVYVAWGQIRMIVECRVECRDINDTDRFQGLCSMGSDKNDS